MAYIEAQYRYQVSAPPPGAGQVRAHVPLGAATSLSVARLDDSATDRTLSITALEAGDRLLLVDRDNADARFDYRLDGPAVDLGAYFDIPVTLTEEGGDPMPTGQAMRVVLFQDEPGLVPEGGDTGQVLTKLSAADYDAGWRTVATGTDPGASYTYPLPDLEEVRRWLNLPATSLADEDLLRVLEAEAILQVEACHVPVIGTEYAPTAAHTQALYRRVGREVAAKSLPLGVMGADSEYGPSRLARWDAEIDRLEGPTRLVVFG